LLTVLFGLLAATEAAPVDAAEAAVADWLVGDGLADGQPSRGPLFSSAPSEEKNQVVELTEDDAGYTFSPSIDTNGDNLVSHSEALKFLATGMPNSCWFLTDSPSYKDDLKKLFRATGNVAEASSDEPFFTYEQAVDHALGLLTSSDSDVAIRMSALFECMGASSATGIGTAQGRRRLILGGGIANAANSAAARKEEWAEFEEEYDENGMLAAILTTMAGVGNYWKTKLIAGAKLGAKYFLSAPGQEALSDFNKCFKPQKHPYFTELDDETCNPNYTPPPNEQSGAAGGDKNLKEECSKDEDCRSNNCKGKLPGQQKTCQGCDKGCQQKKAFQMKLAKNRACFDDLLRHVIIKQDGIERFRYCCKHANGGGGRMFPEDGSRPLELCEARRKSPTKCETKIMRQEDCEMLTAEEIQELFTADKIKEIRDSEDPQSELPPLWKTKEGKECPEFKRDEAKVVTREVYADREPKYDPQGTTNIVDGTGWYAGGPKCLGEVKEVCPCEFSDPQGGENDLYVAVEDSKCQLGEGQLCTEKQPWMCASEVCHPDGTCSAPPQDEVPSSPKEKRVAALQMQKKVMTDKLATALGRSKFGTGCAEKCIQGFEPPEEKSLREQASKLSTIGAVIKGDKSPAEAIDEQISKIAKEYAEELVKDPTFADYEEWGSCCSTYAGLGGSVRGNRVPGINGYQRAVLKPGNAQCMHTPKGGTQEKGCGELSICEVDSRQCKGLGTKDEPGYEPGYEGPTGGPRCTGLQKDMCKAGTAGFGVDGGSCGHCATPLAATCVGPFGEEEEESGCTDGCLYNEMCMHPVGSDKRSGELAGTTAHLVMPGGKEQCAANVEHSGAHSTPPWLRYVWCAPEPEQAVSCSPIQKEKHARCDDSEKFSQADAPTAASCPAGYGMMARFDGVWLWECKDLSEVNFDGWTEPSTITQKKPSSCAQCQRFGALCDANGYCYTPAEYDKGASYICKDKEANCEAYDDA